MGQSQLFHNLVGRNRTSQSHCFRTDSSLHISLSPTLHSSCEITEAAMSLRRVSSSRDMPTREQPAAGAAKLFSMRRPLRYCGHSQEGSRSPLHVQRGGPVKRRNETEGWYFLRLSGSTVRQRCLRLCPPVSQCPEKNAWPPHMRAFNKAVVVAFNSLGDDNCGLRDGLLVKATAVRADFRAVIAAR